MARTTNQNILLDILDSPPFWKYSICLVFSALWWYDNHHMIIWWSSYEDMMTLTCCQYHFLTGTNKQRRTSEDRATQPMDAGGWVSQFNFYCNCVLPEKRTMCTLSFCYISVTQIKLMISNLFHCNQRHSLHLNLLDLDEYFQILRFLFKH